MALLGPNISGSWCGRTGHQVNGQLNDHVRLSLDNRTQANYL